MYEPENLVENGRLTMDIYRAAALGRREKMLYQASEFDGLGNFKGCGKFVDDCTRSGPPINSFLWENLTNWHCGLNCNLKIPNIIYIEVKDDIPETLIEFDLTPRRQNITHEGKEAHLMQIYCLPAGTEIPPDIGIERDGEDHATLFVLGELVEISEISDDGTTFTLNAAKILLPFWKKMLC